MRTILLALCFSLSAACYGKDKPLEVYFVDVEGGQATLLVSPSGESLLVDTGWPGFGGRDADRIVAAVHAAGLKQIDYVLITHFHNDHVGGAAQLVDRIPVGTFIDHGPSVETGENADEMAAIYKSALAKSRHLVLTPGDKVPIKGIDMEVVSAAGKAISSPLAGAGQANPLCADAKRHEDDPSENARSLGTLIRYGKFRMIDLGDLTWNKELELACPVNRIGKVDVYLTTHHGHSYSGPAALVHALAPRVAMMNNGPHKGGDASAWQIIRTSPRPEDIWQIHYSLEGGIENNAPDQFIANLEEKCEGYAVKLTAKPDGSFTFTNTRNGFSKRYNPL
ncbi:MAG: MBL fold metallo-hydrolase [Acidobacteria bacterium]|nr:MBL fold metallo-hydrolase [Acidobacteriota bacterium]